MWPWFTCKWSPQFGRVIAREIFHCIQSSEFSCYLWYALIVLQNCTRLAASASNVVNLLDLIWGELAHGNARNNKSNLNPEHDLWSSAYEMSNYKKHFPSGTPTVLVFKIDKLSRPDRPIARAPDRPRPPDRPLDRSPDRPTDRTPDRPTDRPPGPTVRRSFEAQIAGLSKQRLTEPNCELSIDLIQFSFIWLTPENWEANIRTRSWSRKHLNRTMRKRRQSLCSIMLSLTWWWKWSPL
jgi:hypothetical protein